MSNKKRPFPEYIYDLLVKERDGYVRDVMRASKDYNGRKAEIAAYDHENRHEIGPGFSRPREPSDKFMKIANSNLNYLDEVLKYFSIHFMEEEYDT